MVGAVMFTCGGRTHRFFGESAFDATTFTKVFEGVPLIGMYAGGEIGPPLLADARSQVRPISSISKINDVELAVDDDDKSFYRSFFMLLAPDEKHGLKRDGSTCQ